MYIGFNWKYSIVKLLICAYICIYVCISIYIYIYIHKYIYFLNSFFCVTPVYWLSDKPLFSKFWKRALCYRSGIFLWVQFQKISELQFCHAGTTHEQQSCQFKKFTGTLKMNIFLLNFANTFLLLQRTIAKK